MPLRQDLIEEGSRVSYADAANPRKEGRVVEIIKRGGETPSGLPLPTGLEYRVKWDEADDGETVSDLRQHGWHLLADLPPGNPFDGADIVYAYTRDDAIADGTLVPTIDLVPDELDFAQQAGFALPVALTSALAAVVIPSPREADERGQDVKGRLWDVLSMARMYRPRPIPDDGATWIFPCIFQLAGPERGAYTKRACSKTLRLKCVLGPGDDGAPVATLMLARES
jgi:hypothetical protein